MTTYFISDLHLDENHPDLRDCFLNFLKQCHQNTDALYILGDLFEVWIGDDNLTPFNQQILNALKQLTTAGTPVYFICGNRDFLIGKKFAALTGVKILSDPTVIDLYGEPTLLMHGDLLCTDDKNYQAFRRKAHNPCLQKLFLRLPLSWRTKIATKARQKSAQYTQRTDLTIQDVNQEAVITCMQQYQVTSLIHGHTHRPAIHHLIVNNNPAKRIVLNAWHEHGGGLAVTSRQHHELFTLN